MRWDRQQQQQQQNQHQQQHWKRWRRWTVVFATLGLMAGGCKRASAPGAAGAPPPPAVTVAHPIERQVMQWDEYAGWLAPVESVDVMARVSGYLLAAPFQEGSLVNKGDLLYELDERPFRAALEQAEAELLGAQARQAYAANEFKRLESLRPSDAVSQLELENARQALREAEANVAAAEARVQAARLNVEWCQVKAPISGRIGRKLVTPGNLVNGGAGEATLLTTIASIDPIYCYVQVDERSVLKYQQLSLQKRRISARDTRIPCYLGLSNEQGFPHEGYIDFVDNRLDRQTGTQEGRGIFANPNGYLTPGLYARMRIPGSGKYTTLLIPDAAIGTDQNRRFVLVVKPDNTVESRNVQLGALFGELRSIEKGLSTDDRVIINGIQRARPGAVVKPVPAQIEIPPDVLPATLPNLATQPIEDPQADVAFISTQPTTLPATLPAAGEAQ